MLDPGNSTSEQDKRYLQGTWGGVEEIAKYHTVTTLAIKYGNYRALEKNI